jgi:hypothetical protein
LGFGRAVSTHENAMTPHRTAAAIRNGGKAQSDGREPRRNIAPTQALWVLLFSILSSQKARPQPELEALASLYITTTDALIPSIPSSLGLSGRCFFCQGDGYRRFLSPKGRCGESRGPSRPVPGALIDSGGIVCYKSRGKQDSKGRSHE